MSGGRCQRSACKTPIMPSMKPLTHHKVSSVFVISLFPNMIFHDIHSSIRTCGRSISFDCQFILDRIEGSDDQWLANECTRPPPGLMLDIAYWCQYHWSAPIVFLPLCRWSRSSPYGMNRVVMQGMLTLWRVAGGTGKPFIWPFGVLINLEIENSRFNFSNFWVLCSFENIALPERRHTQGLGSYALKYADLSNRVIINEQFIHTFSKYGKIFVSSSSSSFSTLPRKPSE